MGNYDDFIVEEDNEEESYSDTLEDNTSDVSITEDIEEDTDVESIGEGGEDEFNTEGHYLSNDVKPLSKNKIFREDLNTLQRITYFEITYLLQVRSNMLQQSLSYDSMKIDKYLELFEKNDPLASKEYNIARIELYLGLIPLKLIRHIYANNYVTCDVTKLEINHDFYLSQKEIKYLKNI